MKKVGRPKKKPQEPKDAFHNRNIGEIKSCKSKHGGKAGGIKSRRNHKFPISPHMTDTDILNQVIEYIPHLRGWQKSNISGVEYKGFKKCKDKLKTFINSRKQAQKQQIQQEGDWQI